MSVQYVQCIASANASCMVTASSYSLTDRGIDIQLHLLELREVLTWHSTRQPLNLYLLCNSHSGGTAIATADTTQTTLLMQLV
jgi:hypothetical protein